jgi:hypothetical protein
MIKSKFLAIAFLLTTVTASVFAGKRKFTPSNIYAYNGSFYVLLAYSSSYAAFTTTQQSGGDPQAKLIDSYGVTDLLYAFDGSSYIPLYAY